MDSLQKPPRCRSTGLWGHYCFCLFTPSFIRRSPSLVDGNPDARADAKRASPLRSPRLGKMSSIESWKSLRSQLLMSRYDAHGSVEPPSEVNKTARIGPESLTKTKAENTEREQEKKWPLWIPKIDSSLYPQLCKPAREREEGGEWWWWKGGGGGGGALRCGHLQLFGLDVGEKRRPLIGCCRDAAADRRCRSRAAEAIGGRRRGSSLSESSLSEVLKQPSACVEAAAAEAEEAALLHEDSRRILWISCSRPSQHCRQMCSVLLHTVQLNTEIVLP